MKGFANGTGVAQQRHEAPREVLRVRHDPQRGPVPVHDHRLARTHPLDDRQAMACAHRQRHEGIIGERRAHDRHGEGLLAMGTLEALLAGDLVA